MKLQKTYPTDYNLLIVQDLWEAHDQMQLLILVVEFIKLKVNRHNDKKCAELNTKIVTAYLNTQRLNMI